MIIFMIRLSQSKEAIAGLCRRFRVERLEVFGSATTADFEPQRSDLDFLVRFPPAYDFGPWMSRLQEFERELAAICERPVDVVTDTALRNPWFRREAEKTRALIYDASKDAEVVARHP
jgi:predicted nucleotidyltransferase